MNITVVRYILSIGGAILFVDATASLIEFYGQPLFYQLVRLERAVFALLVMIIGCYL